MGVQTRNLNDSHFAKNGKYLPKEFNDYNKMYDLYVNQHLTKEQLGKIFDCAPHVIDRVLRKLQIQVRNSSQSKIGVQCGSSHHNWKGELALLNPDAGNIIKQIFHLKLEKEINLLVSYVEATINCTHTILFLFLKSLKKFAPNIKI